MAIRPARESDAPQLARLRVRAWREAYRHIIPSAYLESLSSAADELRWRSRFGRPHESVLVWERDGRLDGFVVYGDSMDASTQGAARGEVFALYVAPNRWRQGIGSALLQRAMRDLAVAGMSQGVLWVLRDNVRARAFYEAMDLRPDGGAKAQKRGDGIVLHQIRYSWDQTQAARCGCAS